MLSVASRTRRTRSPCPAPIRPPTQTTEEVAAHEYGHAIAFARVNPYDPTGTAVTWGPVYWASYEGVCPRTADGQAFPGDEGAHYAQNPGEAWADTYRMLNGGQPSLWQFDNEFYPNATDYKLARDDITNPWSGIRAPDRWRALSPSSGAERPVTLSTFDDGPGARVTLRAGGIAAHRAVPVLAGRVTRRAAHRHPARQDDPFRCVRRQLRQHPGLAHLRIRQLLAHRDPALSIARRIALDCCSEANRGVGSPHDSHAVHLRGGVVVVMVGSLATRVSVRRWLRMPGLG